MKRLVYVALIIDSHFSGKMDRMSMRGVRCGSGSLPLSPPLLSHATPRAHQPTYCKRKPSRKFDTQALIVGREDPRKVSEPRGPEHPFKALSPPTYSNMSGNRFSTQQVLSEQQGAEHEKMDNVKRPMALIRLRVPRHRGRHLTFGDIISVAWTQGLSLTAERDLL